EQASEVFAKAARKTQGKIRDVAEKLDDVLVPEMVTPEGISLKPPKKSPLEKIDEPKKIVTIDEQGNPSGTRFRSDYEDHIKYREFSKASQKTGINGAHDINEFEKYAIKAGAAQTKDGINIVSKTPHSTVKGIYKIEYQMPKLDTKGQPTGLWRNKKGTDPFVKTVYDPKIISDKQMTQWGREAFADAVKKGFTGISSNRWEGIASNGLLFEGRIDKQGTNAVRTFYPIF
ncbi:MAG: CdiA family toxin C-terminal domain-containing protein, partial [Pyrinomonadaceae bacterium]